MSDRAFVIAFSVSLGIHGALLLMQLIPMNRRSPSTSRPAVEVIYEAGVARRELRRVQEALPPAPGERPGASPGAGLPGSPSIRIPERPPLTMDGTASAFIPSTPAVVDLTNLPEASHGNPVLLSYFSAIREQIQQAANHQPWLAAEPAQGLVYVSFLLVSSGLVKSVAVVPDRSIPSSTLRDTALRIVKSAGPFPPFPPSMAEPQKTIVVPLEFLIGS